MDRIVKHYRRAGWRSGRVHAVNDVSLSVAVGETLALVGESGSGKSTLGRLALGLEAPTTGRVAFAQHDLQRIGPAALRRLRRQMQMIFQDPTGSLNPRRTLGQSIAAGLEIHGIGDATDRAARVATLLQEVGLDPDLAMRAPHQCSGGQRQRVGIARALAVEPRFLVCDEPVSSLDVSIQAQVLHLLRELKSRRSLAYLFIAHDLAVVHQMADRVAVMYLGTIVETGPARTVISLPRHPYSQALVSAIPVVSTGRRTTRIVLPGEPPSTRSLPAGCPFASRCPHPGKDARCLTERPVLRQVADREVACHHAE
jgi:oligopeptide/dipeptide ABC transporter ATP-binding protein